MTFSIRRMSNGSQIRKASDLDDAVELLHVIKEECVVVCNATGQVYATLIFSKWHHRIITVNNNDDTVTFLIQKNGKTKSETMELHPCS